MERPLNICLISTNDIAGGAAKAAYRLHKGLMLRGHNSVMLVRNKRSADENVLALSILRGQEQAEEEIFSAIRNELINQNRTGISDTVFSLPYPGYDLSNIDSVRSADVINVHWVNYFQSVESIASLLSLHKPVVWTLHDQWAFTGGCHYSAGCEKYTQWCEQCPQLLDDSDRLPELVLKNKLKYFGDSMVVVSPSNWLAGCARKSTLFKNSRVEVIPNGLDIDTFKPTAKAQAKRSLNINSDTTTILFGAVSYAKKRKGFQQLCEAFDFCNKSEKFAELIQNGKIRVITFGTTNPLMKQIGIPVASLGYIDSDEKLALIYSAADFLILPSLEENLPNIITESFCCGTPVIAFKTGGIPDVVKHGQTGYLAAAFDTNEMGKYILDLVFSPEIRKRMSSLVRQQAENHFSLQVQADRYLQLFGDLLRDSAGLGSDSLLSEQKEYSPLLSSVDPAFFTIYRRFAREVVDRNSQALGSVDNSPFLRIISIGSKVVRKAGKSAKQLIKHIL